MVNMAKLKTAANKGQVDNAEAVLELIEEVKRLRQLRKDVEQLHLSVKRSIEIDRLVDEYWFERHLRKILDDNAK